MTQLARRAPGLLAHRDRLAAQAEAALDAMVAEAEELGLYDQ